MTQIVNQKGCVIDPSKLKGWEVLLVYTMSDVDPRQTETYIYTIAKDPHEAAHLAHKYFVKWHRPEEFGPRFPDVTDIKGATCLDLSDIKEAWGKAYQPKIHDVFFEGNIALPFVFTYYPKGKAPTQPQTLITKF